MNFHDLIALILLPNKGLLTLVFEKRKSNVLNAESASRRQDVPLNSVSLIWGLDKCSGLGRTERHEVMLAG